MKSLITGGAGFIGSHLAEELKKQGHKIVIMDNLCSGNLENLSNVAIPTLEKIKANSWNQGFDKNELEFHGNTVESYTACLDICKDLDYVFHLAAMVSVPESTKNPYKCFSVNVDGTHNLIRACIRNSPNLKRFVFSSSSAVYGENPEFRKTESLVPDVRSPYAASKLMSEYLLNSYYNSFNFPAVNLRYFNVFGSRQNENSQYSGVIAAFTRDALKDMPLTIFGDGKQTRDFVSVKDVVKANIVASKNSKALGETINIGNGNSISIKDLAVSILDIVNPKNPIIKHEPERIGDVKHSNANISKMLELLQMIPNNNFEENLKETIDYYKEKSC